MADCQPIFLQPAAGEEEKAVAAAAASDDQKDALPRVLILGGIGFIGRNLVKYLVDTAAV